MRKRSLFIGLALMAAAAAVDAPVGSIEFHGFGGSSQQTSMMPSDR